MIVIWKLDRLGRSLKHLVEDEGGSLSDGGEQQQVRTEENKWREEIEDWILSRYGMEKPHKDSHRDILTIPYQTDEELDRIIYEDIYEDILAEAHRIADSRNGFIEADIVSLDDPERSW